MIKRVKTKHLKPGDFIHDYNCHYSKENIFIEKSVVKDSKIIDILLSWGINEVLIDTDLGHSVSTRNFIPNHSAQIDSQAHSLDESSIESIKRESIQSFYEEFGEARAITEDAVRFIGKSLEQIRKGTFPDLDQTYSLVKRMQISIENNRNVLSLLSRIRKKDEYTLYHSLSVCTLTLSVCNHKGVPNGKALDLAVGALFHDIGKTEINEKIINKPGKLTPHEYIEIKQHTKKSTEILMKAKDLPLEVYDIALHHHEKWDGTGYPDGLEGNQISFGAQLTSVCDIFDAITSDRCYRKGLNPVAGLKFIYDSRGTHLNKNLTNDFIRCVGVYPVGSCVILENGLAGIVVAPTQNLLKPVVKILYHITSKVRLEPYLIDLNNENLSISNYTNPSALEISADSLLKEIWRKTI